MKSETIMLTVALALAIALVGGLIVVPALERLDYYNKQKLRKKQKQTRVARVRNLKNHN